MATTTMSEEQLSSPQQRIILKKGMLKKYKTMKKKYFVLVKDNSSGLLWLEYYDSEKKFDLASNTNNASIKGTSGPMAKKAINISQTFALDYKTTEKKSKNIKLFVITVFSWQDSFSIASDDESDSKSWYNSLVTHRDESIEQLVQTGIYDKIFKTKFDHVWQVNMIKKGLASESGLYGTARLCLTNSSRMLHLYKVLDANCEHPEEQRPHEFPLNHIRKCGHTDTIFCIQLGRSSTIGEGHLNMVLDDAATVNHIHETIRQAMQMTTDTSVQPSVRPRSSSTSDGTKPHSRRGASIHHYHGPTPPSVSRPSVSSSSSTTEVADLRSRCDSMPSGNRQRYGSEGEGPGHYSTVTSCSHERPHSGHCLPPRTNSYSPPSVSLLSGGISLDSVTSQPSDDHVEVSFESNDLPPKFAIPTQPSIREEETQPDDYLSMASPTCGQKSNLSLSLNPKSQVDSSPLTPVPPQLPKQVSSEGYLSMTPGSQDASTSHEPPAAEGYLEMSYPSSITELKSLDAFPELSIHNWTQSSGLRSGPLKSRVRGFYDCEPPVIMGDLNSEFPLEKVKSFFRDTGENVKPIRAYSIGSRPAASKMAFARHHPSHSNSSPGTSDTPKTHQANPLEPKSSKVLNASSSDDPRVRAHSMGSHLSNLRERLKQRMMPSLDNELGTINQQLKEEKQKDGDKKSTSAPTLEVNLPRVRSNTVGHRATSGNTSALQLTAASSSHHLPSMAKFSTVMAATPNQTDHMELDFTSAVASSSSFFRKLSVGHRTRSDSRSSTSSNTSTSIPVKLKDEPWEVNLQMYQQATAPHAVVTSPISPLEKCLEIPTQESCPPTTSKFDTSLAAKPPKSPINKSPIILPKSITGFQPAIQKNVTESGPVVSVPRSKKKSMCDQDIAYAEIDFQSSNSSQSSNE